MLHNLCHGLHGHYCGLDELMSELGRPLPGEIICTRLKTGSIDVIPPGRTQLGLQLVGRLAADNTDDEGAFGVFVDSILPGSVAADDGSIRVGDELLQVGGLSA